MSESVASASTSLKTVLDFLRFGYSRANASDLYYGHGTDNAWDDILTLILKSLSLPLDTNPLLWQGRLTDAEKTHLSRQLAARIEDHVPVPYLVREALFCGLPFYVDERVLIPRSPIGEWIERRFSPFVDEDAVHEVLDMCTGSACLAIACCYAFPNAHVDAADISEDALAVAAINQERHGCEEQLCLIASDCWTNIPQKHYDIIISNPPYVGREEMETLPEEYLREPVLALEAANNGLAVVEKLLARAHDYLAPNGILVVEVGNSEEALIEAFPHLPFTWLECERGGQGVFLLTREQLIDAFGG
ncbi:N5-glutamine S-adenosyl-L-methionine-dependent methyltransferase [Legionella geestiana]|uniref:N5-glutamine S-adenosyl-L-methionine-dependent methyltransferase n=1 Tax=Legionella geestiana TaxID=45065 RepID=A0A0W0U2W7_9GAMM|nr:50S ribosomal protein L3 N(5)-glutamine methyltransferase [Legionella geestiana]KTD01981.1 N5-glutamine S-adenosyl-L-methionine-dependent methyltransferase [Legionella geestiana]QBS12025.1 50S ribosomal protein L3 N(5)-glutamine methyltransferase [Legionella geestiana]QDQ40365.1 50S ribosomal protein L3 N(5)-glutamine methyltransferase [Legionella geestiana]STX53256.1 adenine specific methylase [Legionella geestiana]